MRRRGTRRELDRASWRSSWRQCRGWIHRRRRACTERASSHPSGACRASWSSIGCGWGGRHLSEQSWRPYSEMRQEDQNGRYGWRKAGGGWKAQKSASKETGRRREAQERPSSRAQAKRLPHCRRHCLLPSSKLLPPLYHTPKTVERYSCPSIRHGRSSSPPPLPPPDRRPLLLGRPQDSRRC
jgi:hypothetical protein